MNKLYQEKQKNKGIIETIENISKYKWRVQNEI